MNSPFPGARILLFAVLLFTVLCIPLFACQRGASKDGSPQIPSVQFLKVSAKALPLYYEFIGETKGAVDAEVRARVVGEITEIHFAEGKEVKQGDLLYSLDQAPFLAKRAEAKARLAGAETRFREAEADLARVKPLADMHAVSMRDLDIAVAREGSAKASVEAERAVVEAAEIELGYTRIHAAVSGMIGLSKAKVGELVGSAPNPVILNTISQLDPIHLRFAVNEKDYLYFARLAEKQHAEGQSPLQREFELYLADGSMHREKGSLVSIDRNIDPQTGSIIVEASFPNPEQVLRPGLFGKVRAIGEIQKDAILIPKTALRELQGKSFVFVLEQSPDGTHVVKQKEIETGKDFDSEILVEKQLTVGDTIAIDSVATLSTGLVVNPQFEAGK